MKPLTVSLRIMPVLVAERLTRRYGDFVAVNDVSFSVAKGSCFGLLGPNGAGKTTTIGMLVGLTDPNSGKVLLDGKTLLPNTFEVKDRIGYVPQELALYEDLSARANLQFFGGLYGITGDELRTRSEEVLELSGLRERADDRVKECSGGMKRRLNLALGLLHKPALLVLDEPTVGVDPQSRNAIFDALRALLTMGVTVLYTTHHMEEVERICDRVAIMDNGKLIAEDRTDELYKLLPGQAQLEIVFAATSRDVGAALASHGVLVAKTESGAYQVDTARVSETCETLLAASKAENLEIIAIQTRVATLEEVFLHLTGKSLRD